MFKKNILIKGRHADYMKRLVAVIDAINSVRLFERNLDVYILAPIVGQALGHEMGAFERAFAENQKRLQDSAIDGNPLLQAILIFMENEQKWEGSATDLLIALNSRSCSNHLPKAPNQLTRKLREVEQNLRSEQIRVEWGRTAANVSHIKLKKS